MIALYSILQADGLSKARTRAADLAQQHAAIPLAIGDQIIIGTMTADWSRIMPAEIRSSVLLHCSNSITPAE